MAVRKRAFNWCLIIWTCLLACTYGDDIRGHDISVSGAKRIDVYLALKVKGRDPDRVITDGSLISQFVELVGASQPTKTVLIMDTSRPNYAWFLVYDAAGHLMIGFDYSGSIVPSALIPCSFPKGNKDDDYLLLLPKKTGLRIDKTRLNQFLPMTVRP